MAKSPRRCAPPAVCTRKSASAAACGCAPSARTDCLPPPICASPPETSRCNAATCAATAPIGKPSAFSRTGSGNTSTVRDNPPTRLTLPTPGIPSKRRDRRSSTNHDKESTSISRAATENVSSGIPDVFTLEITGSSASAGKSLRISPMAERTSSTASCKSFSRRNSITVVDIPVCNVLRIFFTPSSEATRLSIFFATSDSSCCGDAPVSATDTTTTGKSISGNC